MQLRLTRLADLVRVPMQRRVQLEPGAVDAGVFHYSPTEDRWVHEPMTPETHPQYRTFWETAIALADAWQWYIADERKVWFWNVRMFERNGWERATSPSTRLRSIA